jgi:hypothetical protein
VGKTFATDAQRTDVVRANTSLRIRGGGGQGAIF